MLEEEQPGRGIRNEVRREDERYYGDDDEPYEQIITSGDGEGRRRRNIKRKIDRARERHEQNGGDEMRGRDYNSIMKISPLPSWGYKAKSPLKIEAISPPLAILLTLTCGKYSSSHDRIIPPLPFSSLQENEL